MASKPEGETDAVDVGGGCVMKREIPLSRMHPSTMNVDELLIEIRRLRYTVDANTPHQHPVYPETDWFTVGDEETNRGMFDRAVESWSRERVIQCEHCRLVECVVLFAKSLAPEAIAS